MGNGFYLMRRIIVYLKRHSLFWLCMLSLFREFDCLQFENKLSMSINALVRNVKYGKWVPIFFLAATNIRLVVSWFFFRNDFCNILLPCENTKTANSPFYCCRHSTWIFRNIYFRMKWKSEMVFSKSTPN